MVSATRRIIRYDPEAGAGRAARPRAQRHVPPHPPRRPALALTSLALVIAFGTGLSSLPASAAQMPQAATFSGTSTVGALFTLVGSRLASHFCTASVVDSPGGDLVLTAAHCVTGRSAESIVFVPDYDAGKTPYGIWDVSKIDVDAAWSSSKNPNDDFAFLVVARSGTKATLQSITGGEQLGANSSPSALRVIGYPDSSNTPISCKNVATLFSATQLQFDCGGYSNGTSGGPFLASSSRASMLTVIGVIGGYEQGGNTPAISYAARFDADLTSLYRVATA